MCDKPHTPWLSFVLAAAAVAIYPSPLLQQWLEFDRQAVAAGELWRIVSCHWTHWSAEHLFWDAGMFVLLAAVCECRSRRALLVTLTVSAAVIPLALWRLQPEMACYRGLSGLDSALFFLVVVQAARQSLARRQWPRVTMLAVLVAAFTAKIGYETFQGAAVFVHTGGFIPVPLAHVVGAMVGLAVGLLLGGGHPARLFFVRRACLATRGCKSPVQPDGGEGQATGKGVIARWGPKEAIAKMRPDVQEPDLRR